MAAAAAAAAASCTAFCLFSLLALASSGVAFNVTEILGQYPDLGAFNALLSETGLAAEINSRQTITILAVGTNALDAASGRPVDVVKRILSLHVILDYYNADKLKKLKSALVTSLYQTTGTAAGNSGFLNVTVSNGGGTVKFGLAAAGEPLGCTFVKEVVTKPYNLSVLQVSDVIVPLGIDSGGGNGTSPPPPSASPSPKEAPAPSKPSPPPSASPKKAPSPSRSKPPAPASGNATATAFRCALF